MTDAPRWDWRGPVVGAIVACVLGLIIGWSARPTVETVQTAAAAANQQGSTTAQIQALAAQIQSLAAQETALAVKIDALTERSYAAYTRSDAAADRTDVAHHFDALDGRVGQLEQELSAVQHQSQAPPSAGRR